MVAEDTGRCQGPDRRQGIGLGLFSTDWGGARVMDLDARVRLLNSPGQGHRTRRKGVRSGRIPNNQCPEGNRRDRQLLHQLHRRKRAREGTVHPYHEQQDSIVSPQAPGRLHLPIRYGRLGIHQDWRGTHVRRRETNPHAELRVQRRRSREHRNTCRHPSGHPWRTPQAHCDHADYQEPMLAPRP